MSDQEKSYNEYKLEAENTISDLKEQIKTQNKNHVAEIDANVMEIEVLKEDIIDLQKQLNEKKEDTNSQEKQDNDLNNENSINNSNNQELQDLKNRNKQLEGEMEKIQSMNTDLQQQLENKTYENNQQYENKLSQKLEEIEKLQLQINQFQEQQNEHAEEEKLEENVENKINQEVQQQQSNELNDKINDLEKQLLHQTDENQKLIQQMEIESQNYTERIAELEEKQKLLTKEDQIPSQSSQNQLDEENGEKKKKKKKEQMVEITVKELMKWDEKTKTLQTKIKSLKIENSNLKIDLEEQQKLLANKNTRSNLNVEGLEERCKALQSIVEETTTKLQNSENFSQQLKEQNRSLQEDFEGKDKEVKNLREEAKEKFALETQLSDLRENMAETQEKYNEAMNAAKENEEMFEKIKNLEHNIKQTEEEKQILQKQLSQFKQQNQIQEQEIQNLKSMQEELSQKTGYLEKQSQRLETNLKNKENQIQDLKTQIQDLDSEKDILLKKYTNEVKELKNAVSIQKDAKEEAINKVNNLEQDLIVLREKNARNVQSSINLENDQKMGQQTKQEKIILEALSIRNSELEEEKMRIVSKLKESTQAIEFRDKKINAQINLIQELNKEIFSKNPTLQEYMDECDAEEIEQIKSHKLMDVQSLQSLMEKIAVENVRLRKDITLLGSELNNLMRKK